jgi:hypothetical protein
MRIFTSLIIAALMLQPPIAAGQETLTADVEATAFKQMAEGIPPGTRVSVRTKEGRRVNGTLMTVEADRIVVKRDSRVPEPALGIAFADLTRLERVSNGGFSMGKALGIGLAAGVGAILTLFGIAVAIDD